MFRYSILFITILLTQAVLGYAAHSDGYVPTASYKATKIGQRLSAKADSLPFQEREQTSEKRTTLGWLDTLNESAGSYPGQPASGRLGYVHHS